MNTTALLTVEVCDVAEISTACSYARAGGATSEMSSGTPDEAGEVGGVVHFSRAPGGLIFLF